LLPKLSAIGSTLKAYHNSLQCSYAAAQRTWIDGDRQETRKEQGTGVRRETSVAMNCKRNTKDSTKAAGRQEEIELRHSHRQSEATSENASSIRRTAWKKRRHGKEKAKTLVVVGQWEAGGHEVRASGPWN